MARKSPHTRAENARIASAHREAKAAQAIVDPEIFHAQNMHNPHVLRRSLQPASWTASGEPLATKNAVLRRPVLPIITIYGRGLEEIPGIDSLFRGSPAENKHLRATRFAISHCIVSTEEPWSHNNAVILGVSDDKANTELLEERASMLSALDLSDMTAQMLIILGLTPNTVDAESICNTFNKMSQLAIRLGGIERP